MSDRRSETPSVPPISPRRRRILFLSISAISAVAIIIASRTVLLPFIFGMVVAYLATPTVMRVAKYMPRWTAILLVYICSLGGITGFISFTVPTLITEGRQLSTELPALTGRISREWIPSFERKLRAWASSAEPVAPTPKLVPPPTETPDDPEEEADDAKPVHKGHPPAAVITPREDGALEIRLADGVQFRQTEENVWRVEQSEKAAPIIEDKAPLANAVGRVSEYVSANAFEVFRIGQQIVGAVSRGVFYLFLSLMLGGYLIYTHESIIFFFRELWSEDSRPAFDRFLRRLDRGLSGVVRGQLLICVVNGVLSAIGFWLFDLKYWPILAIIAGVMSLIPIFGSILSTVPAVLIGLTQSTGTAVAVLIWIIAIHQLEANFLNPKIIGDAAKIHPVLVVFSLLVGEHYFGIAGALFAVPCLSVLQTIFLHFRESTLGLRDPTATMPPVSRPADPDDL